VTRNEVAARQMHLWRGIFPVLIEEPKVKGLVAGDEWISDVETRINTALKAGEAKGFFKKGDTLIVLTGWRGGSGNTNTLRIIQNV
jgi:pyruvate kinase